MSHTYTTPELCIDAFEHLFSRIRSDRASAGAFGFGTTSFEKMIKAYAALKEIPEWMAEAMAYGRTIHAPTREVAAMDLMQFCSTDPKKIQFNKPWSEGEFTYACLLYTSPSPRD